jgi:hypothetical protein
MPALIPAALVALALVAPAEAARPSIGGHVIDRNGNGMSKAIVTVTPAPGAKHADAGTCQLVTDRDGNFLVDYLRDEAGERAKLRSRMGYTVEVFKPGYHTFAKVVDYRHGALVVDVVTMVEDTIDVRDLPENLDPALYRVATQSSGANYEGQ